MIILNWKKFWSCRLFSLYSSLTNIYIPLSTSIKHPLKRNQPKIDFEIPFLPLIFTINVYNCMKFNCCLKSDYLTRSPYKMKIQDNVFVGKAAKKLWKVYYKFMQCLAAWPIRDGATFTKLVSWATPPILVEKLCLCITALGALW